MIKLRSVHSSLRDVHSMIQATYMRRMRNNNLEIKIAGSSCRPQQMKFHCLRASDPVHESDYSLAKFSVRKGE